LLLRARVTGSRSCAGSDNGLLRSDTAGPGTTSYVYDAAGKLLLQKDPGQTTLFIFGEQLVLNTSRSGAVTGTRFIALPDGGTAVRTGAGTGYWLEPTEQQGIGALVLDNTAATPVWRQETPFGAPRGMPPSSWPDSNGFLRKPMDSNTGLTVIGARNYDPSAGRFTSVDPALNQNSPQQMGLVLLAGRSG